jgi:hypothetical protein
MSENQRALMSLTHEHVSELIMLLEGGEPGILPGSARRSWINRFRATETILESNEYDIPIHFTDLGTEP